MTPHPASTVEDHPADRKVDPPGVDSRDSTIVERVASVTFSTETPLPDRYREAFEIAVQLPDAPGPTLAFPAMQACARGEPAWSEVP